MDAMIEKLKLDIIEHLNLEDVSPEELGNDDNLFDSDWGLDSIDALELIVLLEKNYGVKVENPEDGKKILHSVRTIATFIQENQPSE